MTPLMAEPLYSLPEIEKNKVARQIETYRQAALSGDWETWGRTLVTDVHLSPANTPPMSGREAAVAWVQSFPTIVGFDVNVQEITGVGDLAFARGMYELRMQLPDGTSAEDRGTFLQIHRRAVDGSWPYTHMMFHSTNPVPSPS